MPGCVLRASGDEFLPAEFLGGSSLKACNVFHIGEPRGSGFWRTSGFTVEVSSASGDNFGKQIEDAVVFLTQHEEELNRLLQTKTLGDVRLDFGINRKHIFVQSSYLPPGLLTLAGRLKIGLEISIYGSDDFER